MNRDIAIIGVAGIFPDAKNKDELITNLINKVDSVRNISDKRIKETTLDPKGSYIQCGFIDDIDKFDYKFFNITLGEAEAMDPVQRLLLQTVYNSIENAAYDIDKLNGSKTSVYAAANPSNYHELAEIPSSVLRTGNAAPFTPSRIAREFNFLGAISQIDTACSSSLVALNDACNDLILGDSEYAIVCSSNIVLNPSYENDYYDTWSSDGKSRSFSSKGDGMSRGEGVISILLKPLDKALEDKDNIHAIIKSVCINNNAAKSTSLIATNSDAQTELYIDAWNKAGISPEQLAFIEVHGSGTQLGDALEIEGLTKAFSKYTSQKQICPISTLKSNIGHGLNCSGLMGLVKAIESLKNNKIYPTINSDPPSELIDFDNAPVFIAKEVLDINTDKEYCGISAMGASGVNGHVILQKYTPKEKEYIKRGSHLITITGKTENSLKNNIKNIIKTLDNENIHIEDVSYTLNFGRKKFNHRLAVIAENRSELIKKLQYNLNIEKYSITAEPQQIITILSDLDDNAENICNELIKESLEFKKYYEECRSYTKFYNKNFFSFVVQYGLYKILEKTGITRKDILSIGLGKIVFEVISGKRDLKDAIIKIVSYQGEEINDIKARVKKLIDRHSDNKNYVYVAMGNQSKITRELVNLKSESSNYCVIEANKTNKNIIINYIKECFLLGLNLNWDYIQEGAYGNKIELPGYSFEKDRCWIREEPLTKNETVEDNNKGILIKEDTTVIEMCIANIWAKSLKLDKISIYDDFFELGGNSLKTTEVINEINKLINVKLSFEDIFDFPTVKELAEFINEELSTIDKLRNMWSQTLKIKDGIKDADNFFELGGHSLLATQVLNGIIKEFKIKLNFEDFFAHPTLESMANFIEKNIDEGKNKLSVSKIEKIPNQEFYELSSSQKRLWVLSKFENGSEAYNTPIVVELNGNVDENRVETTLIKLIQRHEAFRTIIKTINGSPKAKILDNVDFKLEIREENNIENDIKHFLRPFDLENDILIRAGIIKRKDKNDCYILVIVVHHIISDGTSLGILTNEFCDLYNGKVLPELTIQYKDFAAWQNKLLLTDTIKKQETYWKDIFSSEIPILDLPTEYQRPAIQSFKGANYYFNISSEISNRIKQYALDNKLTIYMVMLAAYNILLNKYTEKEDIVVGCPIAGRHHSDLNKIVGMFVNTLALRNFPKDELSFRDFVMNVKDTCLGAYENQDYQFEDLVDLLNIKRDTSRNPIFETMLTLQNMDRGEFSIEGIEANKFDFENKTSMFDITLKIYDDNNGYFVDVEYCTSLFSKQYIKRFTEHFIKVLEDITNNPDILIKDIEIITKPEKDQIVNQFNNTNFIYNTHNTIKEIFEESVELNSNRTAVIFNDEKMTYREFNDKCNQLAHKLKDIKVDRNVLVGVIADRSIEMYIAIMAIIKAGGAYVPISPEYPNQRIEYIVNNSNTKLILSSNEYVNLIRSIKEDITIIDINDNNLYTGDTKNLPTITQQNDLVYIIYTSGSTGLPKGVQVENISLINRICWMQKQYPITKEDVIIQKTIFTFDVSVWEIFWWSFQGAAMCILPQGDEKDAKSIITCIEKNNVTIIHFVPSMLTLFLDYIESENINKSVKSLRHVFSSGEALTISQVNQFRKLLYNSNKTQLNNLYGPTEATIDVTYFNCMATEKYNSIPIGKPIDNIRLYVLDKYNKLQPIGIPGELCIAGIGLARGYLNNKELTDEKFLANQFINEDRIYKTGDIAKWREDGNLEYLGRNDHQVKLRGFRIELGEIERCIDKCSFIKENVVVLNHEENNNDKLIAYLIPNYSEYEKKYSVLQKDDMAKSQLNDWEGLWNNVYLENTYVKDERFNYTTWNSSFTGEIYPYEEMREWLDNTVTNIRRLKPKNVIEIGCGLGMVLFEIAPDVSQYLGTDLSVSAINYVSNIVNKDYNLKSKVKLLNTSADNIEVLTNNDVDLVILNSVVQYFPDEEYFNMVLTNIIDSINGSGKIYLGDIRNYKLLREFHTMVSILETNKDRTINEIKDSINHGIDNEVELLFSPEYFYKLKQENSKIKFVEIQIKNSVYKNEMALFRYDVTLFINESPKLNEYKQIIFDSQQNITEVISNNLLDNKTLLIKDVPNTLVQDVENISNMIENESDDKQLIDIQKYLNKSINNNIIKELKDYMINNKCIYKLLWNNTTLSFDILISNNLNEEIFIDNQYSDKKTKDLFNNPMRSKYSKNIISAVKSFLKENIPEYMIPANYVIMDKFELNSNGKIDRKMLPEFTISRATSSIIKNPSNEIERVLCEIWKEILEINEISTDDDFFEIGGHSLKVNLMILNIAKRLKVDVPFQEVFNNPTIKELGEYISKLNKTDFIAIEKAPIQEYYQVSSAQKSMFLLQQIAPTSTNYNLSTVVKIDGDFDIIKMKDSFEKLVNRHETLRTSFEMVDGNIVQIIHNDVELQFQNYKVDMNNYEDEINKFIRPFDLSENSLLRVAVMEINEKEAILAIDMHHIISDGVSMNILIEEFFKLYNNYDLEELKLQYKDFAVWQEDFFKSDKIKKEEEYWKKQFNKLPSELIMPYDFKRPKDREYFGETIKFELSPDIANKLDSLAKNNNTTVNIVMYSIYAILISLYTNSNDIVIGSLVSGRNHIDLQKIVGMFANSIPIRTNIDTSCSFTEVLENVKDIMIKSYENSDCPFETIVRNLNIKTKQNKNPLFNTMLVFHSQFNAKNNSSTENMKFSRLLYNRNSSTLDFKLDIMENVQGGYDCYLEYSTELFLRNTMDKFIMYFNKIINIILENPQEIISNIVLFDSLDHLEIKNKIQRYKTISNKTDIYITSTFTSEPILKYLKFWIKEYGIDTDVHFSQYNQVFQELLEENSLFNNGKGYKILLIRFEDFIRYDDSPLEVKLNKLENIYKDLISILINKKDKPLFAVGIFDASNNIHEKLQEHINDLNNKFRNQLKDIKNISIIDFADKAKEANINNIFDEKMDKAGHIPFTEEFFALIATNIYRNFVAKIGHNYKVVVVDCDNTLWKGVCGEEEIDNLIIDENYKYFHDFLLKKKSEGYLLAICSKNNLSDLVNVFENRKDLKLALSDFVSIKSNWNTKSNNIKEIAQEINISLESVIFIDDNPVECMDVLKNCPEVLTLNFPINKQLIKPFINNIWALDKLTITDEDSRRSEMYIADKQRETLKCNTSINEYLKNLDIKIDVRQSKIEDTNRISQLTYRTNQFNSSSIRRSEEEILEIINDPKRICFDVRVKDRFGYYGIVSVIIGEIQNNILLLDTFLMSCRVIGKNIEKAILFELRKYCEHLGISSIKLLFIDSKKNKPIKDFIISYGFKKMNNNEKQIYYIDVCNIEKEALIKNEFISEKLDISKDNKKEMSNENTKTINESNGFSYKDIGQYDIVKKWIADIIEKNHKSRYIKPFEYLNFSLLTTENNMGSITASKQTITNTELFEKIKLIWKDILGIDSFEIDDDFFNLGGNSLLAVRLEVALERAYITIPEFNIFKYNTVRKIAEKYLELKEE